MIWATSIPDKMTASIRILPALSGETGPYVKTYFPTASADNRTAAKTSCKDLVGMIATLMAVIGTTRTTVLKTTSADATVSMNKPDSREITDGPMMASTATPLVSATVPAAAAVERIQRARLVGNRAISTA